MIEALTGRTARIAAAIAAAALCATAGAANATTYALDNVNLDDGTSVTGTFSTDVNGYIQHWDITSSDGFITGNHYTPTINPGYSPGDTVVTFNRPAYFGYLQLTLAAPLPSSGSVSIVPGFGQSSFECDTWTCQAPSSDVRYVSAPRSGPGPSLTAVPEPATWAMVIGGLGLVGAAARRRRSVAGFAAA